MKDNFSAQATQYAQFRPEYPAELYHYLQGRVTEKHAAWDCATGNGQAAKVLATIFEEVQATDISEKQLANAFQAPNIHYTNCPAEKTPFQDNSFDLITVAQALHWFSFDNFFNEVKRVAKPNAYFATWMYGLNHVNDSVDTLVRHLYKPILGDYWDAERHHIDELYAHIPFPFETIETATFSYTVRWHIEHYLGYLRTWSSVQKYIQLHNDDPIQRIEKDLRKVWGETILDVTFPIFLKMGKVKK